MKFVTKFNTSLPEDLEEEMYFPKNYIRISQVGGKISVTSDRTEYLA